MYQSVQMVMMTFHRPGINTEYELHVYTCHYVLQTADQNSKN